MPRSLPLAFSLAFLVLAVLMAYFRPYAQADALAARLAPESVVGEEVLYQRLVAALKIDQERGMVGAGLPWVAMAALLAAQLIRDRRIAASDPARADRSRSPSPDA